MKVILLKDVENIGKAGTIKEVRNGYGFNFLLPEGLAELATPEAIKQAERFIAKRAKEHTETELDLKAKAKELSGKKVVLKMKAKKGTLFGSVGREEVAAALKVMGTDIDAKAIDIEKPFKEVGTYPVEADFGHGVKAKIEVSVEAE